jgi:probable HAF family extracellular repeat protein
MKRSIARGVSAAALLAAALSPGRPAASQVPENTPYTVRYLLSLGGTNSRGNSINNADSVAGYSNLQGDQYRHATLWSGDTPIDLGTLGSPNRAKNSNVAWPVKNTLGLIVGISQTDSPDPWRENWSCYAFFPPATSTGYRCVGFVWENGVMRPLPTLGGTHGYAAAANNHRQIVGWAENTVRDPTCTPPQVFQFRAVVWGPHGNQIHELPVLPGDTSTAATAINDKGQIVGISGTCDDAVGSATAAHAVLWEEGTVKEIPNLGGAEWNTPTAINERGDIAGFSDHPGDQVMEAFIWTKEQGLEGLGFLDEHDAVSEAFGINERRQIVGLSCGDSGCRAFLWQDGAMTDLNSLVPLQNGIVLTHAMDINDDGVITGRAFNSNTGELQAYVATPVASSPFAMVLGSKSRARDARRHAANISLPADVMQQILSPLGPGLERLGARTAR